MDCTGDFQTIALLSCRINSTRPSRLFEWVEVYRDALDVWCLWEARAMFDIGRAELLKQVSKGSSDESDAAHTETLSSKDPNTDGFVQPGLFARCNYCNQALSAQQLCQQPKLRMETWLKSQKSILSCCPSCRNHLPRCYVCLLSLGSLNPSTELKRQQDMSKKKSKRYAFQTKEM